jgi:HK97 gp10 family phage protein
MPTVSIKLLGAEDLLARLKTLEPKLAKKVLRQSIRAGAKLVLEDVKARAPVRSGLVRSKLRVRAARRKKDRIAINVTTAEGDYVGKTFYAPMVELGHHSGKRARGASHRRGARLRSDGRKFIEGRHFIKAAFEARQQAAAELIQQQILEGIEREART